MQKDLVWPTNLLGRLEDQNKPSQVKGYRRLSQFRTARHGASDATLLRLEAQAQRRLRRFSASEMNDRQGLYITGLTELTPNIAAFEGIERCNTALEKAVGWLRDPRCRDQLAKVRARILQTSARSKNGKCNEASCIWQPCTSVHSVHRQKVPRQIQSLQRRAVNQGLCLERSKPNLQPATLDN